MAQYSLHEHPAQQPVRLRISKTNSTRKRQMFVFYRMIHNIQDMKYQNRKKDGSVFAVRASSAAGCAWAFVFHSKNEFK
jgi:hypothetical protein